MRNPFSRHDRRGGRPGAAHSRRWQERFGLDVLRQRWTNAMPRFFRIVFWVCSLVSGTALAVNSAVVAGGGTTHEWWNDLYPYFLGIPAGAAFVCKFTQQYNGRPIDYSSHRHAESSGRTILDRDIDHLHAQPPGTPVTDEIPSAPSDGPADIDPYNED